MNAAVIHLRDAARLRVQLDSVGQERKFDTMKERIARNSNKRGLADAHASQRARAALEVSI